MGSARKNKWLKYLFLKNYAPLSSYVPETQMMSRQAFWTMLEKYGNVIVKPVWGSRGRGIVQVSDLGSDTYAVHHENIQTTLAGKENTYNYIRKKTGNGSYMVQKRIDRPTINNRPFDMRVIVQRKRNASRWVVTAKVIKVAGKGYIVTNNERSHGTLLAFRQGIKRSSIQTLPASELESHIDAVSIIAARRLKAFFPAHRIYGLDVATDWQGNVFIIEANLYPSMSHFLKLKDKSLYRRIMSYK